MSRAKKGAVLRWSVQKKPALLGPIHTCGRRIDFGRGHLIKFKWVESITAGVLHRCECIVEFVESWQWKWSSYLSMSWASADLGRELHTLITKVISHMRNWYINIAVGAFNSWQHARRPRRSCHHSFFSLPAPLPEFKSQAVNMRIPCTQAGVFPL